MKRIYNQPEVLVAHVTLESMILAGSPANTMGFNDIDSDQW